MSSACKELNILVLDISAARQSHSRGSGHSVPAQHAAGNQSRIGAGV
jgi:hypothetical protein